MIRNRNALARTGRHALVLDALAAGIEASHPRRVLENALEFDGSRLHIDGTTHDLGGVEDLVVLGGGNAAGHAAAALESILGNRLDGGVVVTDDPAETRRIDVVEGTHPLPAERNVAATRRLSDRAAECSESDLVLFVIGGGASALLCAPHEVSLADYRKTTTALLESGATITEINAVRKHLSTVKGGRLARALAPARTVGLIFSDVAGNAPSTIGSGPTAPDDSTYADCLAVRDRYDLALPDGTTTHLEGGVSGDFAETVTTDDPSFERVSNHVLADGRTALDAAATVLSAGGYCPAVLSSRIEGEAREVGTVHVGIARECLEANEPFAPPVALLSGGETTVTVAGEGEGGPNHEFTLSAALSLDSDLLVASVDTDGIDGSTPAAGALADGETVSTVDRNAARTALRNNDAFTYLRERNRCIETGPTGTNVNDLRILLVGEP